MINNDLNRTKLIFSAMVEAIYSKELKVYTELKTAEDEAQDQFK